MEKTPRAATFVEHDFSVFDAANAAHFVALREARGPRAIVAVGEALRTHATRATPGWPRAVDRSRDRAAHLRLIEILDRVRRVG